ncbi:hypothetical protein N7468_008448 [Penicillium chermesinum]|uniref:Uncharacterized protein n=1 Tax=Penicillium chermesinum TaxID=63820 RepID=A0A9W9NPS1_9EURO|nr:uncharacterized protein N7468_008448 [Penicillium chermesinum]KAJ5223906.1 hypothetical protein N7468_008448 [Penicillium chermesinum]
MLDTRGRDCLSQGFIYSKQFREPRALVVYHNLHCLDALREVYYAAVNGTLAQRDGGHHHHEKDAEHVRHCLDYLRQSVMCAADTNLEPVVNELASGGDLFTTGWGFYRELPRYRTCEGVGERERVREEFVTTAAVGG